ncbi:MAG: hypothetical protein KJO30_13555 [Boseongicola sp.]|nr:hypothetical protein [Boseongicola sp.]NNJ66860.1 hypothetical protein [Boseongicola sp.]
MRIFPISLLGATVFLVGCVDWPDVPEPEGSVTSDAWPTLQPLSEIGISPTGVNVDQTAFQTLQQRAESLRLRAALLRSPVTDQDSFDRLRARLSQ